MAGHRSWTVTTPDGHVLERAESRPGRRESFDTVDAAVFAGLKARHPGAYFFSSTDEGGKS